MARMGRPQKQATERLSHLIALRLKPAEYKTLEKTAQKLDLSVSKYIRLKLGLRGEK